ncbi:alkyldihydroxyacetonephosphate synthase [Aequitasia blattaphilus]|uniref:FAD-binding oxidoreductase n=1 Tax=Aequitasia blattaphilus TaxID=2949332 RepID=A0ABT1E724_9FIRM|nr:FAD-binding oxidoreductase [Aequitasia blattaphilus]MCP1101409.1 FAD-binding oxidoreductase [Aequitasia blattaphilus]MCR8614049.1 FAD-binding oxidoreductase [Aequitasia blattaphilus]
MELQKERIVEELINILGSDRVITDETVLKESSLDRYRKFEQVHEIYTQPMPAAVVYVESTDEVKKVLMFANEHGVNVVPRTGQSAIEGGLETAKENSIVVDGSGMNKVLKIDKYNMQVTVQCGVPLQELDDMLREQGYTTGHSPQSKPLAQLGGLVATRSIGQFSTLYGGIEDMVVGLEAVFPNGEVCRVKNIPRRAAGPDIRHVVIGNEGALCYITEVTIKIFKYQPENNLFLGYTIDNMKNGFDALRAVMVEGFKPSIARLYDAADASLHFDWSGDKNVLIFMAEGPSGITNATAKGIDEIVKGFPGVDTVDSKIIEKWFAGLNWGPEEIAEEKLEILATNNIGITTEVSGCWDCIYEIYDNACKRIMEEVPDMTLMGGHSSHSYINGTNMYFVYYYNVVDCTPEEEINKYHNQINRIICEEVIKYGGSIVHHHGLGKARAHYVWEEYGSSFYILDTLKKAFDPNGIMNMGTLIPIKHNEKHPWEF